MTYTLTTLAGGEARFADPHEGHELRLPAGTAARFIAPPKVAAAPLPEAIDAALAHPVGTPRLAELAAGAGRVAVIVSDTTRSVPGPALLDRVMPELAAAGVEPDQVRVVVATGVHRPATADEMAALVGPAWAGRVGIESHRPRDPDQLVPVGATAGGNQVLINRTVAEADLRVALGQVEPHEFAGFTGGPKSILAGVSGEDTIRHNHAPDMLLRPGARPGLLDDNPVWQDMLQAARLAPLDFIVNVVLTPGLEIAGVAAGDVEAAHAQAVDRYLELYGVPDLPEPADVIVALPGPPLNRNLYQAIKAIVAAECVVRDGGVVVLAAACPEGTGGERFVAPYRGARGPGEVIARLRHDYDIEMDHALLLSRLRRDRGLRFVACVPGVDDATLATMQFEPAPSLQAAFEAATRLAGRPGAAPPRTVIFPQPQKVVINQVPHGAV